MDAWFTAAGLARCSRLLQPRAGLIAVPGFVDMHVHAAGGGGEAGPSSRTPEAQLSELLRAGITTVVGTTGTDSVSRSQVCWAVAGAEGGSCLAGF